MAKYLRTFGMCAIKSNANGMFAGAVTRDLLIEKI